ncbi:hypothetical protein PF010_g9727 [Phytophthora fragariae]|uniref:Rotatin N-terminal domain-containing protein n=1 Tax=Phytophthora fragariae TaxID=53985 RepID=A0A6G0LBN6_9STRA|nr:hypothetical protein PF010_g9727 [Phytophthora fragariae]KAE9234759.1 hypothetical protein PF004_g9300 [Phytophthora fragariae]
MAEDGAAGRLDALVLKLRHPLAKIRARTLQSLLFKLRERLVRWQELEPLHNSLVPALLASLEPPLELQALHVLQLLVQSQSEILLASLQRCGAAQTLQRGANSNAELRAMYEKLLRQIYVFKVASKEENREQVSYSKEEEEQEEEVAAKEEKVWASRVLDDRRRGPKVDELEARGWRFAQVTLASVDEQFLFEFEVKLRLRTETQDLVAACAAFRNDLLRNFPAEVFLQRPAVLQYLLHLVQQPILLVSPGTTSERRDALVERAMEVSMGVNYFDEMMNSTFSNKRGNLPGAVVMASVKAIESFLFALKLTRKTCLNPTHVVHAPSVHVELFDSYDTRRVLYPRARVESGVGVDRIPERRADIDQLEQYSLSGAIYRIFMSVLPLLRSARHPRLHLLNLLITALPDLLEKGGTSAADIHIQKLDKMRLERIFEVLGGICRPVPLDQAGCGIIDPDLEFTHSMTWKIVELVLRLLHLYPSSRYCVDTVPSNADTNKYGEEGDRDVILIPPVLWQAVKLWAANSLLAEVAAEDWNDESLVQNLSKIDETIPAFVNLKHSSQEDARMIVAFVEFAKAHRDQLTNFGHWEKPPIVSLEVAQKAIRIRNVFDNTDAEAIADATLQAIWTRLSGCGNQQMGQLSESDIETIGFILCDQLSDQGEKQTPMARFFRGLMDLVNNISNETNGVPAERRRQFVNEVLCDSKFLMLLLLCLARLGGGADDQANSAAFWEILHFALNQLLVAPSDNLVQLQPVIPLLQHFAYIEPSEGSSSEQRSTQPQLADILNRVETSVPDNARYILISRCLLHESSYIRKSAASGVIRLVSQLNPETLGWITKEKEIREDPFGCSFVRDDKRLSLDTTLMESPLPVTRTYDYQPSENELSSQLSKLTHLRKVISGTSSAFEGMREAAFKELVMLIENAPVELFALFEELDKLADFIDLVRAVLQDEVSRKNSSMVQLALLLFRALLLRSRLLRSAIQRDTNMLEFLLPLIFHSSAAIRTQMYYIILLLTCSAENFLPEGAPVESGINSKAESVGEAKLPELIKPTFGLYSDRWSRCFVGTCSLEQQMKASCALLTKRVDVSWFQEVKAIINQIPGRSGRISTIPFSSLLDAEYTHIAEKVRDAPSHGRCLNAIYHLLTVCTGWRYARERFVKEWEADFERYFAVPPKSERDEVIIGSLVNTLSVLFCSMTRGEQLRALVVVKRNILPLMKRSQGRAFSLQVARLLLNVSESKVGDLFLSLAADTDIIAIICAKYSSVYATEPVLHAVMLEVLLRFARPMDENADTRLSPPSREKIRKRLTEMLSPLLTIVCRHRVPGSFLERDVFIVGSQCMVAILRTLPRESLLASDSPLQHTDSNILLDGSWASRFLFDHVSPIRELGFLAIAHSVSLDPLSSRLLEMAFETSTDDTESDAVRAAACNVLTKEVLRFNEYPPDQQSAMVETFRGSKFAGRALCSLSNTLKTPKVFASTASAFARLVRVLYMQSENLVSQFGDIQKELMAAGEDDIYPVLIQALSLREWKNSCNRYCSGCMLLPRCDEDAWRCSLLPAILDLMIELLNLFQAVCRDAGYDQVTFFLMHTTLQYQLMELVGDIHTSFDDTRPKATLRKQYEVLELCAGTLSILLVQAFDQHSECDTKQFGAPRTSGFGASFVAVVEKLLESHHPIDFRVSFSRVVPAISLLIPGSLHSSDVSVINALCSAVFDLSQEIAEFRPLSANSAASAQSELQGRVFPLTSIRRVSCALQVLLETCPSLQQFVQIQRSLPFALTSIKESFSAIRIAGGFGGKRARGNSSNSQDAYVLDLCGRIQTHMEVISAIIAGNKENQRLAKDDGLLTVILSNWNVMKAAHVRGSQLLLRALHLLANYTYGNDSAKASMLVSLSQGSGKISGGGNALLPQLFGFASTRGEVALSHQVANGAVPSSAEDIGLSNAACQVLKTVMLNTECVLASMKTGSVPKMVDSLQDRLKQTRQTSKIHHLENENLAHMLNVLSSIACNEEGARVLYASWATVVSLVFDDTMHSSDSQIRRSGCLLMRNLALSQATKNNFGMWEDLLDEIVATSVRVANTEQGDLTALRYLSAALWSLVYDNQKARALLLSRPAALHQLQQVLTSQQSESERVPEIVENLRRVMMLVQE